MRNFVWKDFAIRKPSAVTIERIRTDAYQGDVITFKLFQQLLETVNFSRSYEGKVERVKIQNVPFAVKIIAA